MSIKQIIDKMESLLNETQLFEILNLKNDGILNFAINQEKRARNIFKNLLRLIVYLKKQGDLLNQLGLGQV